MPQSKDSTAKLQTSAERPRGRCEADAAPALELLEPAAGAKARPLRDAALRGSAWTAASFVLLQAIRLVGNVAIASLLSPAVLGVMVIVRVVAQGLEMCSDLGLSQNVVQHRRGDEAAFLNTAWTLQVMRGLVLFIVCAALAWPASVLYGQPQLFSLMLVVAFLALLGGFYATSLATMLRRLEIAKLKLLELTVTAASMAVIIGLAVAWRTIWALMAGWLVGVVLKLIFSHVLQRDFRQRPQWDRAAVNELYSFGKWIFLSTLFAFVATLADRLILGKLVTWNELGVYSMALAVAILPLNAMKILAASVLYPVLARKVRSDPGTLAANVLRTRRIVLSASLFVTLCVALFSPMFFRSLYDERYQEATWIAPLLLVSFWFAMLQASADRVLLVLGRTRPLLLANFVQFVAGTVGSIGAFLLAGLPGFILGLALGTLSSQIIIQQALRQSGIRIVAQDAAFTAACAAVCLTGLLLAAPYHVEPSELAGMGVARLAAATAVVVGTGVWTFLRIRRDFTSP